MNIFDYFGSWQVPATPRSYVSQIDPMTGSIVKGAAVDSDPIKVLKYNATQAERYFAQTWADDIDEVFVAKDITNIKKDGFIVYAGIEYSIDGVPVNQGEQDEIWVFGGKVIR